MQQQELAQMRQRDANLTALAAIGPRKKRKVDSPGPGSGTEVQGATGTEGRKGPGGISQLILGPDVRQHWLPTFAPDSLDSSMLVCECHVSQRFFA